MKTAVLLAGLPGVGKSTIARKMSAELGAHIVDIDDFKKTYTDPANAGKEIDPPELRRRYYQEALKHILCLFDQGVSTVLVDEVFHLNSLRTLFECFLGSFCVHVVWVEILCPYPIVKRRVQSAARQGHLLSKEETLEMHHRFGNIFEQFPSARDNHIVFDNSEGDLNRLAERLTSLIPSHRSSK